MKHAGIDLSSYELPLLVGVLNLSPESFFKGSVAGSKSRIEDMVEEMTDYGVDCLDVGAMSTRPLNLYGGERASIEQEYQRITKYLPEIMDMAQSYDVPVAVDTQYSKIAEYSIAQGVDVINDISGLKTDDKMAPLLGDHDVDIVVMASRTKPGDICGMDEVLEELARSISIAASNDIDRSRISVDPGFGGWQGRGSDCDISIIRDFERLHSLNCPIYIGVSRKSTVGTLGGGDTSEDRLVGSIILTKELIDRGAQIVRTHDVKATRLGLNVFNSLDQL